MRNSNNGPLVSIIITNYNKSNFLLESVKSCLKQSYKKNEIIFFDDKSSDNSLEKIKNFKLKNKYNFRIISNSKKKKDFATFSHISAIKKGLSKAKGKYIFLLDSDDYFHQNKLKEIIKILLKENIKVISSTTFNPELSLKKGNFTKVKPNNFDKSDINIGVKYLLKLNMYNHVQGLIVKNNKVIIKEGIYGTKKMIQSINKINKNNGILIKFPKKKQDLRVDLPTVGLDTFKDCKKYGLKGIVLKANQNIILDKKKCIKFANKNNIFLKVL